MGNDCDESERIFRYETFHQSIYTTENDIKKELYNPDISNKKFCPFGLINQKICRKYKFLLNPNFDKNEARKYMFNYNDLAGDSVGRDFSYIKNRFTFQFPDDIIFINKDFMDVINDYIRQKNKKDLNINYDIIIGGGCLIMKNAGDEKDNSPFIYIILYNEIKENKGNQFDFFLYVEDNTNRNHAVNYILQHNLLEYFKKIQYNYREEHKKIIDENNKEIGYIVRINEATSFENYLMKLQMKKQQNFQNIPINNISQNTFLDQMMYLPNKMQFSPNLNNFYMINNNFMNNNSQNISNNYINNNMNSRFAFHNNIVNDNQNQNKMNQPPQNPDVIIFITFTLKKTKMQMYIDVDENAIFSDATKLLEEKYEYLRNIKNKSYSYQKNIIPENNYNKTLKELNIRDNSDILIYTD